MQTAATSGSVSTGSLAASTVLDDSHREARLAGRVRQIRQVLPTGRSAVAAALLAFAVAGCASGPRPLVLLAGGDLAYPAAARAAGVEGEVTVRYDVTAAGRVARAVVLAAEPPGVFEEAALAAVRSWRFRPPTNRDGAAAAPGRVSVVRFRLGDGAYGDLPPPRRDLGPAGR